VDRTSPESVKSAARKRGGGGGGEGGEGDEKSS
jgi:hypothetical protein